MPTASPAKRKMTRRRYKRYPGLTPEQQLLVEEHKWIAGRLAHGARCLTGGHTGSLTREDLESIANFALCVAATRYKPDMQVKYSTYAWNTARGYIQHALRDYSRMVRTPRWVANYKTKVFSLFEEGKSHAEVAEILGIDEEKWIWKDFKKSVLKRNKPLAIVINEVCRNSHVGMITFFVKYFPLDIKVLIGCKPVFEK